MEPVKTRAAIALGVLTLVFGMSSLTVHAQEEGTTTIEDVIAPIDAPSPDAPVEEMPILEPASTTDVVASTTNTSTSTPHFDWKSMWPFHGNASTTHATTTDPDSSNMLSKFWHFLTGGKHAKNNDTATTTPRVATSTPRVPPVRTPRPAMKGTHLSIRGTITSISHDSISVALSQPQANQNVTVSSKDALHGAMSVAVGDLVDISATQSSDGTIIAQFIHTDGGGRVAPARHP